jgi:hypothetical protein
VQLTANRVQSCCAALANHGFCRKCLRVESRLRPGPETIRFTASHAMVRIGGRAFVNWNGAARRCRCGLSSTKIVTIQVDLHLTYTGLAVAWSCSLPWARADGSAQASLETLQ